jgi:hypothetical protein
VSKILREEGYAPPCTRQRENRTREAQARRSRIRLFRLLVRAYPAEYAAFHTAKSRAKEKRVPFLYEDFIEFISDVGARPSGVVGKGRSRYWLQLIDSSKPYQLGNCRWTIRTRTLTVFQSTVQKYGEAEARKMLMRAGSISNRNRHLAAL